MTNPTGPVHVNHSKLVSLPKGKCVVKQRTHLEFVGEEDEAHQHQDERHSNHKHKVIIGQCQVQQRLSHTQTHARHMQSQNQRTGLKTCLRFMRWRCSASSFSRALICSQNIMMTSIDSHNLSTKHTKLTSNRAARVLYLNRQITITAHHMATAQSDIQTF